MATIDEGTAIGRDLTNGRGADAAIVTVGVDMHAGRNLRGVVMF